jgi:hypothetical protein
LAWCEQIFGEQIARFFDDFRELNGASPVAPSKLNGLKVPEDLLATFRIKRHLKAARIKLK